MKTIKFYKYLHYTEIDSIKRDGVPNLGGHKWWTKKAAKADKEMFNVDYDLTKITVKIEKVK